MYCLPENKWILFLFFRKRHLSVKVFIMERQQSSDIIKNVFINNFVLSGILGIYEELLAFNLEEYAAI